MTLYADIIIDISLGKLDQTFQYRIPDELAETLEPGDVVEIPFGRGDRITKGYVLRISPTPACPPEKMKTIRQRVTSIGGAESKLTALALWMRDYYGSTTVQALRTVLPFRSSAPRKKKKRVALLLDPDEAKIRLEELRKKHQTARARLLEALIEDPVLPQEAVTGTLRITQPVLRSMEEMGIIRCESEQVFRTPAVLEQLREEMQSTDKANSQLLTQSDLAINAEKPADERDFVWKEKVSTSLTAENGMHDSVTGFILTAEQQKVVDAICGDWDSSPYGPDPVDRSDDSANQAQDREQAQKQDQADGGDAGTCSEFLIHGVTGSGKTAVYMELIAKTIARGQQAILLIPEISLTYQNVVRFYHAFGDRISILHSRLSQAERYDQFERAKAGDIDVMIGPRSALFTPFEHLGLIIIDEEHEPSYKSETMPRYDAREVARKRAALEGATLVLGSATPSLESYYVATQGVSRLLKMEHRATGSQLAAVSVVDMRKELRDGNSSILSRPLVEKMHAVLEQGQQSMLFLNRRGYAGFYSCRSCGHVVKCPHCDVSLSLHRGSAPSHRSGADRAVDAENASRFTGARGSAQGGRLICHYCGYEEPVMSKCPKCGSPFIGGFKAGTQQIETVVAAAFPGARILRMDADTTRGKDGHAEILRAFGRHEADILIGTQMIVKGHDFPQVALVGALAADLSLNSSDFRAAERTYQLLAQAAGRAGRGEVPGEVVIQTYRPEHYAISCAAAQTYEPFYEQEIEYRSLSGYPPVGSLMSVHCASGDKERLTQAVSYLARFAKGLAEKYHAVMMGPADEAIAKVNDIYRMVFYIRHKDEKALTSMKNYMEQYIGMNSGFSNININFER
ncbi:MAG: primosomal protein N' [Clostridiales bacterium]|nr:primosomal protein N' [Clostridiales bacterium]